MAKIGRPRISKETFVVSVRFDVLMWRRLQDIAFLESRHQRKVSAQELVREAVAFTYDDNERMRDMFRRRKYKKFRKYFWYKKR